MGGGERLGELQSGLYPRAASDARGASGSVSAEFADYVYERINVRTHAMVVAGVVAEVAALDADALSATAGKTIGLWDFRAVAEEATSLQEAIASVQQTTRHYAKRQATWFRRETAFVNVPVSPLDRAEETAAKICRIFGLKKPG